MHATWVFKIGMQTKLGIKHCAMSCTHDCLKCAHMHLLNGHAWTLDLPLARGISSVYTRCIKARILVLKSFFVFTFLTLTTSSRSQAPRGAWKGGRVGDGDEKWSSRLYLQFILFNANFSRASQNLHFFHKIIQDLHITNRTEITTTKCLLWFSLEQACSPIHVTINFTPQCKISFGLVSFSRQNLDFTPNAKLALDLGVKVKFYLIPKPYISIS